MAEEQTDAPKPQRIVVIAADGSEYADYAFKWYADNVHKAGDHVLMAHVAQYGHVSYGVGQTGTSVIDEEEKKVLLVIQKIENQIKESGIDGKVVRLRGDPGHAIVQEAEEQKADFIVTGTRGMGTLRRTFMGSVSDYIMHHSHIPVFVCRHKEHLHKHGKH